jgi:hypothetical protein
MTLTGGKRTHSDKNSAKCDFRHRKYHKQSRGGKENFFVWIRNLKVNTLRLDYKDQ